MKRTLGLVLLALGVSARLAAQQDITNRLEGRVPADVAAAVSALVDSASVRRLPAGPLIDKALEGVAKGVPGERIVAAVQLVLGQLNTAAAALRSVGGTSDDALTAGAFAISAGLGAGDVVEIARTARPPYSTASALQVAGLLTALGVPAARSVGLVIATIRAGRPVGDLATLPAQVQAAMARGAPAAVVAAGLERAAAAHAAPRPPNQGKGQDNPHRP